ncbi:Hypothetical predicted protein [Paramuricea clavata]|uniref:Uncharacterized protein n=1 Tax=Paramuricea clavata TaxID=317549 RepID=A0A6S7I8C2_PARCT|nr:Hypothetical predicted protein [Paramuricea clavata]
MGIPEKVLFYGFQGLCDAFVKAYGAVIHLKLTTSNGMFLNFVIAKTRISPINKQIIPRLELLSAVIIACVTYEELETILTEIECVLNSRPLTYVFTKDLKEPLPPSHLLFIIVAFW